MHPRSYRCRVPSDGSHCSCTECNTSFCVGKRNKKSSCNKCKEYETSVYYYGEESHPNTISVTKEKNSDTSDRIAKQVMDVNTTENGICSYNNENVTAANANVKDINIAENDKDVNPQCETYSLDSVNSQKVLTNTNTTAQLSAQIMNVSYKVYKESVSIEKTRPPQKLTSPNDIFKKIKEAYDACTCKICECLIGKSVPSPNKPCDCEPCNCKDCTRYKKGLTNAATDPRVIPSVQLERIEKEVSRSKKCNCKLCECVQCTESSPEPCTCKPCQCIECKSMVVHRTKTIIVAPVEEGNQRANCLCAPCDCARCTHRGLNLSPNRVHEMSTGINRHPNCHCETCMNESCEPNGTDSCRCETHRGIMSKPFDRNPRDFDIHTATVSNNPLSGRVRKLKTEKSAPINLMQDNNIYFQLQSTQPNKQHCMCRVCECIVCQCKDNIFNDLKISQTGIKSLKTLKRPGVVAKYCKCSPCECQFCSDGFRESKSKSCSCQVCDCLYCEGAMLPENSISRIIPVLDTLSKETCEFKCNSFHRTLSRSKSKVNCIYENSASDVVLYPIKDDNFLRPSVQRNNPISEPELLKKSSEYTHLKHSKGQSNVFRKEASAHDTISKQNLTIYRVIPENKFDPPLYNSTIHSIKKQNKSDPTGSKNKDEKKYDKSKEGKEGKDVTEFYYASTSKISSSDVNLESLDHHRTQNNVLESVVTTCLKDVMGPSTYYTSHTPSLLSIPLSTHNLLNLSHSSLTYTRKSHQLSISSPDRKVERSSKPLYTKNKNKNIMDVSESYNYDDIRSSPKYKVKQCDCNICQCCGSCDECDTETDNTSKIKANEVTQTLQYATSYKADDDYFLCNRFATYFSSNFTDGRTDSIVVRNQSKTSFLNSQADDTQNACFAWRLRDENPRAYNTNTSAPYERALITLQKAREFSLELRQLLEKYEKANLEFESVSKKLKQSHEKIFNSFKYDACGRIKDKNDSVNICNGRALSDNFISQKYHFRNRINDLTPLSYKTYKNNLSMTLNVENTNKPQYTKKSIPKEENDRERFGVINDITANKSTDTITTNSIISVLVDYNETLKSKSGKEIIAKCINQSNNKSPEKLAIDLLHVKEGGVITDKESDNIELTENYYNIYQKLIMRTAQIGKISKNNISSTESKSDFEIIKTLDCETLKKLIKQEMKVLVEQLSEIEKKSKSRSAFGEKTKLSSTVAVVEEQKAKYLKVMESLADISTQTKSTKDAAVESKSRIEVMDALQLKSTLNHPEMPQKELLPGLSDSLPIAPAINNNIKKESTTRVKKSKSGHNETKVGFLGVRRVSDHTVTVKWQKPKVVKDVQGYEILVDGRPVQKILNPTRCMAVITCLPHSEKVLLSIRTITKKLMKSGPHPCSTIVYRPRAK